MRALTESGYTTAADWPGAVEPSLTPKKIGGTTPKRYALVLQTPGQVNLPLFRGGEEANSRGDQLPEPLCQLA